MYVIYMQPLDLDIQQILRILRGTITLYSPTDKKEQKNCLKAQIYRDMIQNPIANF